MTCKYCELGIDNYFMEDVEGREDAAYIQTRPLLAVRFPVSPESKMLVSIPIDYCPKCGRRLGDEA